MYSTLEGAKKRAKILKRLLADSGFDFPLNKCQEAVARAGSFRDWRDLQGALGGDKRARLVEPEVYDRRLLAALPHPCRPPVIAWLDGEPPETTPDAGTPPRWYRDVFPYLFATAVLHRSRTPVLRSGSGVGQKLRAELVVGLLLNTQGGRRQLPRLEPDTLALVYRGEPSDIYGETARHPRFETELEALVHEGVLDIRPGRLSVLSPDCEAVIAHVARSAAGKAEQWAEEGGEEALEALHGALATIGVRDAMRVASAIVDFGSDAYITPSGPVLELLSELAEEGEIETFAKAYRLFATIRPRNAGFVRASVPAKISARHLPKTPGFSIARFNAYASVHPDWAETLKGAVDEPAKFAATVAAMADAVAGRS